MLYRGALGKGCNLCPLIKAILYSQVGMREGKGRCEKDMKRMKENKGRKR